MGKGALEPAAGWLPRVPFVVLQGRGEFFRWGGPVPPGAAVGHPVEVPARPDHLEREPRGTVPERHGDVRHHFAYPPPPAQRRGVPRLRGQAGQDHGQVPALRRDHPGDARVLRLRGAHDVLLIPGSALRAARYPAKRSREVRKPAWACGDRANSGTLTWRISTPVRVPPRSVKVTVTVIPDWASVHTSLSGGATSS